MNGFATSNQKLLSLSATKRLGRHRGYGRCMFGNAFIGDDDVYIDVSTFGVTRFGRTCLGETYRVTGIWRTERKGKRPQYLCQNYYLPKDPRSGSQLEWRENMRQAVRLWRDSWFGVAQFGGCIYGNEKDVYNLSIKGKKMTVFNLFVKNYLLSK